MQAINETAAERQVPDDDRRRRQRAAVLWAASLECGGQVADCVVLNLGLNGALLRMAVPFESSYPVTLRSYHFGHLDGRVIWQEGNAVGLQFEGAPEQVVETLSRALPELTTAKPAMYL